MNMVLSLWAQKAARQARSLTVALLLMDGCSLMSVAAVTTSSGIPLAAEADQTQLATADLVVILGGKHATLTRALRDDLRFASALGTRIIATGSAVWLLAKAGLLQGRRFILPDADRQAFGLCFPTLCPAPDAFTYDGTLTTCPDGQIVTDLIARPAWAKATSLCPYPVHACSAPVGKRSAASAAACAAQLTARPEAAGNTVFDPQCALSCLNPNGPDAPPVRAAFSGAFANQPCAPSAKSAAG